jgi:PAS domain S-box-containing protein
MKLSGGLILALLVTLSAASAVAAEAKRVLIVHSFGSTAPPFTTHSTAFERTLTQEMGKRVDLDQVSLDMARYAQPDMEGPFVEFLLKRLEQWHPDLVIPVGSPAGRFVVKYRDRLFPDTPVIYTGMDRRTLPPGPLANAAFVGESFNLAGLVEDILEMAPETNHVAVIVGATPLERYWAGEFRRAFEPFTDRVRFTWFNDLTFDQMLERAASMPPRSFLLLALLLRDASGVTLNQDEALQRLHAVTSAPINGLFVHQLGLGIVGGRLYQAEVQGVEAARIAVRVLGGEPVSGFPPLLVPPDVPRYDWRELRRWSISERRLPPGSVIEFREPPVWMRYWWWIVGAVVVALAQAALILGLASSLTRRRRAERALQESEERTNLAADSAGAGLWSLDRDTGRLWATPRLREIFQLPPAEDLTGESLLAAVHPEDRALVRESFARCSPQDPALAVEFRVVRDDGGERWIVTRGHAGDGRSARTARLSGSSVDITDRKLAENRLRESESRFRTVADSAPVLIWMADVDRRCTFLNKPWLDFTGRPAAQALGDGWTEGVHPDDVQERVQAFIKAFDGREPFTLQYRLRRHDGEYRWISDHGVPRYDSQGRFAGYIGSALDITERLRAEERFRQVFEAAPNAMVMVNARGTVVLVNAQMEKLFGYSRAELVGLPIETLVPERSRPDHPSSRRQYVTEPRTRPMGAGRSVFGRRKDGGEVPLEVGLNPVRTVEGLFIVASVIDITERQKAEAESQQLRQELAHISRVATVGELTAAIVHELGQPLTAILSNAQAGLRLLASGRADMDEIREILEDVAAADLRATTVIQHLRSLFRKGEVERRPVPLNDVITELMAMLVRDAEPRRVSVVLDLAPGLPRVSGDRVQLQQVILNLVVNAFDALAQVADGPRQVTVRTRALEGAQVQVDVVDTGPGIAADQLGSIFKPFVTSKGGGMGLGLSVSLSIVTAHKGQLWAESGPEGGATFHVALPAIADGGEPEPGDA